MLFQPLVQALVDASGIFALDLYKAHRSYFKEEVWDASLLVQLPQSFLRKFEVLFELFLLASQPLLDIFAGLATHVHMAKSEGT